MAGDGGVTAHPDHEQSWTVYGRRQLDRGYSPPVPERIDWGFWPGAGPGAEVLGDIRGKRVLDIGSGPEGRTASDTGLTASTAYTYTVRAKDAAGNMSPASTAVTATTLQYKNNDTAPADNQIKPGLQIVNTGTGPLDLSTVTLRYYFTGENGASTYNTSVDYAALGSSDVKLKVVAMPTAKAGADHYLEVGFTTGAGTLAAGQSTGDIQARFNKSDWSSFDESDDYSRGTDTAYADTTKVTAYVNGTLTVGTEP